ncbi:EamA family transporter [Candidatus Parcubacteria bacterium]|nr:EamA family transporter [Candidatus Parcubacteria bacterium]
MHWLTFAVLTASSYGVYNFFVKISANKLSPTIAIMFLTGTAFLVAAISTIFLKFTGQNLTITKNVIIYPVLAGLFAGVAEIFYLLMYSKNAPLSIGLPLVMSGTIIVAVFLGIIFLKEDLSVVKSIGILITIIGLLILTRS